MELHPRTYALLMLPQAQPLLEAIGRVRARNLFLEARARCPAYARFLAESGWRPRWPWRLADVPVTTKENYVKRYGLEERCFGGALAGRGEVIDESSGSSGLPNNWVRNAHERNDVKRILQLSYGLIYGDPRRILLNCFALGPWATGMNVSMSLADVGTLKSIGPDGAKLENTLRMFGPGYRYLLFGYPPFIKSFVDATMLDLSTYHVDVVVGGEGMSEALRDYLLRRFQTVVSSYGASDLEINIGVETQWTIALRKRCAADPALSLALFGRDTPPMIFQYNALDYRIETGPSGELIFTILRARGAAPKIRYDLKDVGGTYAFAALARALAARGVDAATLAPRFGHFPILYVYGRADLTAAFFGAKIYPTDLEAVILEHPTLSRAIRSFQFDSFEDERVDRRLAIHLELTPGGSAAGLEDDLGAVFYRGLAKCNQDFREVTRMFKPEAIEVRLHPHGTGPFEGADVRIKNRYIAPGKPS